MTVQAEQPSIKAVVFVTQAVGGEHDVGLIMDTWTRQMGFPVVTVQHRGGNKYRLHQERFLLNPEDKKNLDRSKSRFKWASFLMSNCCRLKEKALQFNQSAHKTSVQEVSSQPVLVARFLVQSVF